MLVILIDATAFTQDATNPFAELQTEQEFDDDRTLRLFNEGKFDDAFAMAKLLHTKLGQHTAEEKWSILMIESHMAQGKYEEAQIALDAGLDQFPKSIRHRWVGAEVYRYNNKIEEATKLSTEIEALASKNSWQYRDVPNQIVLGKYFASRGADAKDVLVSFFNPIKKRYPDKPEILLAIGELALSKNDYAMAAENYLAAVKLDAKNTDALLGVANSFLPSDPELANGSINAALAVNPNHVECLLLVADQHLSAERYDEAKTILDQVLSVNAKHPVAWAYRAVIAHLDNDPTAEGEFREKALACWPGNPVVDHTIGRELSEKYRFKEGETYQRRALVYDDDFLPAKMQLAHDLLRLGQELEGWKLADEVFDVDQYSVVAHNLVMLRDQISKFRTLERDGFVVRMDAAEADIYGQRVLDLLSRAKKSLCDKYDSEIETPIFIEIFPRQQDFAIRTFGLPGGDGFLGVCFGRVITMNSPQAQRASLTSWESVLWHEFCHVVTLQKTNNKMPRWLSEGISVYEEKLANPAWGESLNLEYRRMILSDDLTPVSKLSSAFMRPPSAQHLQFAYYESSLVVEYLIENFGLDALKKVLQDLSIGTPINDSLRRHCAPLEFIDKKFAEFAKLRAEKLAPGGNWDEVELDPKSTGTEWANWNRAHPDNLVGLMSESNQWVEEKNFENAAKTLMQVVKLSPSFKQAYLMQAMVARKLEQPEQEFAALESLAKLEASSVELFTRLLEISSGNGDWEKTKDYSRRLLAVNPLISAPHRYLAMAAEKTNDDEAIIQSLQVLAKMDPLDAADVHFRLASALFRSDQFPEAKRQVIMALEQAPRFRDAHALLLKIVEKQDLEVKSEGSVISPQDTDIFDADASDTQSGLKKELP